MRKPKKVDRLAYKTIGEETIILDTKLNQQVHQLNELGSFIWNLCDGEHDVSEIIEIVCLEFEVTNDVASSDVHEFLDELEQMTLIYDKAL
jgi:hypothetical protein